MTNLMDSLVFQEIENIHAADPKYTHIWIGFEIDRFQFSLLTDKSPTTGLFYPIKVCHMYFPDNEYSCPFCHHDRTQCEFLNKYINELFLHLIESPSIRLHWLYLPHI